MFNFLKKKSEPDDGRCQECGARGEHKKWCPTLMEEPDPYIPEDPLADVAKPESGESAQQTSG